MNIERNEARMVDIEIPLNILEQKVQKLEQQYSLFQIGNIDKMVEQASQKINQSPMQYIPAVYSKILELQLLKDNLAKNAAPAAQAQNNKIDQTMVFQINNLRTDIEFLKKTFTPARLQQIDALEGQQSTMQEKMQFFKIKLDNCAKNEEIENIYKKLNDYAQVFVIDDIKDSIRNLVNKEDINIVQSDIGYMKKDIGRFCSKDEFLTRFNAFNSEINTKLSERPTTSYFKKILNSFDDKFSQFEEELKDQSDSFDIFKNELNKEIKQIEEDIKKCQQIISTKLSNNEGAKIWKNFQRFALYEDLQDLYKKTLPEINKFEKKLNEFQNDLAQKSLIISHFDELLAMKSSKTALQELYNQFQQQYASKALQDQFVAKMEEKVRIYDNKMKEQREIIEYLSINLSSQISKEIRAATSLLKESAFEDDGTQKQTQKFGKDALNILNKKIDQKEFNEKINTKANQKEVEIIMRQIEILHKQIQQVVVLIIQELSLPLESQQIVNKNELTNKQVNLLNQAVLINKWLKTFNVTKIDDCFDDSQNKYPSYLREFDQQIERDLSTIKHLSLSPNNNKINQLIKSVAFNKNIQDQQNKIDYSPSKSLKIENVRNIPHSLDVSSIQSINKEQSSRYIDNFLTNSQENIYKQKKEAFDKIIVKQNDKRFRKSNTKMSTYIKGEDQRSMTTFIGKKKKKIIEVFQQKEQIVPDEDLDKQNIELNSIQNNQNIENQLINNQFYNESNFNDQNQIQNLNSTQNSEESHLNIQEQRNQFPTPNANNFNSMKSDFTSEKQSTIEKSLIQENQKKKIQKAVTKMQFKDEFNNFQALRKSDVSGYYLPGIYNKK